MTMTPTPDDWTVGRRLRSLRHLAGFSHPKDLAAVIDQKGLGDRTLRAIENDRKHPERWMFQAIAEACGVAMTWWSQDFSLPIPHQEPAGALAEETARATERSRERSATAHGTTRPPRAAAS